MKRYTIGQFNEFYKPCDDEVSNAVRNFASWLNRTMGDTYMIVPSSPGNVEEADFAVLRYASVPVGKRQPYRMGLPWFDIGLHNRLRNIPFDLLHCHSPFQVGRYALLMARRRGIPVVATFHPEYHKDIFKAVRHPAIVKLLAHRMVGFYSAVDEVWIPQPTAEATLRGLGYTGRVTVVEHDTRCWESSIDTVKRRYMSVMQRKKCELMHRQNRAPWPERLWPDPMFELSEQLV